MIIAAGAEANWTFGARMQLRQRHLRGSAPETQETRKFCRARRLAASSRFHWVGRADRKSPRRYVGQIGWHALTERDLQLVVHNARA